MIHILIGIVALPRPVGIQIAAPASVYPQRMVPPMICRTTVRLQSPKDYVLRLADCVVWGSLTGKIGLVWAQYLLLPPPYCSRYEPRLVRSVEETL
jgi:hypothetical protein